MSLEIKNIRPVVLCKQTKEKLDEFRGFRHVVRNVYEYKFSAEKISYLMGKLPETNKRVQEDIQKIIKFLEEVTAE